MGMVPPRPLLPATPRLVTQEATQEQASSINERYVPDGYGGLISVEGLDPIYTIGKTEPTGYLDRKSGLVYCVEDKQLSAQYEDALVDYRDC